MSVARISNNVLRAADVSSISCNSHQSVDGSSTNIWLAQITKVMSCAFKVKEASVMADGRKFRSLHDQAAIDIPELSNMTALDLLELFMADKMLRNIIEYILD